MKKENNTGLIKSAVNFVFDQELPIYSAALSFNIIFAIIPFLMLGFYAASFFPFFAEFFGKLREFLVDNIVMFDENSVSAYINSFMHNYQEIGIIGLIFAIYTNYVFLHMYDNIAQKIFGCVHRDKLKAVTLYTILFFVIAIVIYLPIGALLAVHYLDAELSIDIFPIQLFLSAFVILKYIPNRYISYTNAVTAAIVATILIEGLRSIFVYYVLYSKSYLTIYGSFATLFLFFVWINVSAHLFLLCMKFCAYLQNASMTKSNSTADKSKGIR